MENKFKFFVGAILAICVISYVCSLDDHKEVNTHDLPENTSYFNLMGISIEEIDKIEVSYQSINSDLYDGCEKKLVLTNEDALYTEVIGVLQKLKLSLNRTLNWEKMKSRYVMGSIQLSYWSNGKKYQLPVLDIYEKQSSKPYPVTWVIYEDSVVYNVDYSECWAKNEYQGVALYFTRYFEPLLREDNSMGIKIPAYYGMVQNAHSWLYDCNYSTIFSYSDYVFRGKVLEANYESGYKVKVLESYKGQWEEGYVFSYQDGTGYKENGVYYALINETERPLNSKSEYIFFMKKHPLEEKFEKKQGVEYVYLSDRQCGVCEIIDNRVWPIFNALPETSWYIGQTLEEIEASWK